MVLHLVKKYPRYLIINYDKVDYCSSFEYLQEVEGNPNYEFIQVVALWYCFAEPVKGDILNTGLVSTVLKKYKVEWVLHFAAQTHVGLWDDYPELTSRQLLQQLYFFHKEQCFGHACVDRVLQEGRSEEIHSCIH